MNIPDVVIKRLAGIDELERHGFLFTGYESDQAYRVEKTETDDNTVISLRLEKRDSPYVKRWARTRDDLEIQKEVAAQGLSWGAFIGDRMVGVALLELREWNRSLHLHDLEVMPEFRGRGLGGMLLDKALEMARDQKARVITLETQTTNYPAIKFYRRHGYQIDGVDLSLYTNQDTSDGEVALTMKLKL